MKSSPGRVQSWRWLLRQRGRLLQTALLAAGFGLVAVSFAFLLVGAWDEAPPPGAAAFQAESEDGALDLGQALARVDADALKEGLAAALEPTATSTLASTPTVAPAQPTAPPPQVAAPQSGPTEPPPAPPTAAPPPPAPAAPDCPTVAMSGYGLALFEAINSERTLQGMPALAAHGCAVYVAQIRSDDMASRGYFSHTSPEGATAFSLLDAYGVPHGWAGENLARNNYPDDETVAVAIRDLMASEGHRANILSGNYTHLGVAVAFDGAGMKYYTMVFIGPP